MSHIFRIGILFSLAIMILGFTTRTEAVPTTVTDTYDPADIFFTSGVTHTYTHDLTDDGVISSPWYNQGYILNTSLKIMFIDDEGDSTHTHTSTHQIDGGGCSSLLFWSSCSGPTYLTSTWTDGAHYEYVEVSIQEKVYDGAGNVYYGYTGGTQEVNTGISTYLENNVTIDRGWDGKLQVALENYPNGGGSSGNDFYFAWSTLEVTYDPDYGPYVFNLPDPPVDDSLDPNLQPVPEPTTMLLLGIGLVGLAGAEARRRRKKKAVGKAS